MISHQLSFLFISSSFQLPEEDLSPTLFIRAFLSFSLLIVGISQISSGLSVSSCSQVLRSTYSYPTAIFPKDI